MLTLKHLPINSFNENIAYLHKDCVAYKLEDIKFMTKVEIHGGAKPIYAFLNIVDDENLVSPEQLALNTEAFSLLNLPEGSNITLALTPPPPASVLSNAKLPVIFSVRRNMAELSPILPTRRYSNMDIASFLVASGSFMTPPEVLALTEALVGNPGY